MSERLQVARDAPLAAADVERQPAGRRQQVEERVAMEAPVAVVHRQPRPLHPGARVRLPLRAQPRRLLVHPPLEVAAHRVFAPAAIQAPSSRRSASVIFVTLPSGISFESTATSLICPACAAICAGVSKTIPRGG